MIECLAAGSRVGVAAVVVTYNRKQMLGQCLDGLLSQDRAVDAIYVIDNGSEDGTWEFVRERYVGRVICDHKARNMGCSGGMHAGMKRALDDGYDWIWVMDDDSVAEPDCLRRLLVRAGPEVGFLAPLIVDALTGVPQRYHHKRYRRRFGLREDIEWNRTVALAADGEPVLIHANAFVGPLVSRRAIMRAGLPDCRFFVLWDDAEYTYRITREMNSFLVPDARIRHCDGVLKRSQPKGGVDWKAYYYWRNGLWFQRRYGSRLAAAVMGAGQVVCAIFGSLRPGGAHRGSRLRQRLCAVWDGLVSAQPSEREPRRF